MEEKFPLIPNFARGSFRELQKDLATKSSNGKLLIAENSDHMVTRNQPEIIVEAIKEVVDVCRSNLKENAK